LAKQLDLVNARLNEVTKQIAALAAANKAETAESNLVVQETADIAKNLKATHDASKEIDAALARADAAEAQQDSFDNSADPNYYFTGEGHFQD
jgi:hypothetical protein